MNYCVICLLFLSSLTISSSLLRQSRSIVNSLHRSKPFIICSSSSDELDGLKLDKKKLPASEQERLDFIQRLTTEADDLVRAAGFSINGEQSEDEIERAIRDTEWSGQSDVVETTISQSNYKDLSSRTGLAVGDIGAFMTFALIGRSNHAENIDLFATIGTVAPFIVSWLAVSPLLGAYTRKATATQEALLSGLLVPWAVSVPIALAMRGVLKGAVPPPPFIAISLLSTLLFLYMWRTVYIKVFGNTSDDEYRSAGFMEIFKMVGSLIKRW